MTQNPPLRLASLGTSPPRSGGADGRQALPRLSSTSRSGGEVARAKPETERGRSTSDHPAVSPEGFRPLAVKVSAGPDRSRRQDTVDPRRDIVLIGMTDFKSARLIGNSQDKDIFELVPFITKVCRTSMGTRRTLAIRMTARTRRFLILRLVAGIFPLPVL
jgi:hypothetical protein